MIPEKYREDEEIIRLTVEQIQKDFGENLAGLAFTGNKATLFIELTKQLSTLLKDIRKNNLTLFRSLMYRVDIKESEVANALALTNSFEALAEKIIQREFQKVLTRKYFSKKGR